MGAFMTRLMPTWYLFAALLASTLILAVGGIWYTSWAIARERAGSERRQCEVFRAEVEYYVERPPDNARTQARKDYYQGKYDEYCRDQGE
jgi:hypothetical protein